MKYKFKRVWGKDSRVGASALHVQIPLFGNLTTHFCPSPFLHHCQVVLVALSTAECASGVPPVPLSSNTESPDQVIRVLPGVTPTR